MRTAVPRWTLVLLVIAASLTVSVARQSQGPATKTAGSASQDQAKNSATASAKASRRKIPCKTPENASLCFRTHGRLSFYEGWVNYQIWKIGTRRMLGIFSGPSHYPALTNEDLEPEFPPELNRAYEADNRRHKKATGIMWTTPPPVFADFEVCPLRPERKRERQPVCIEAAKNIIVQNEDY